MTLPWRSALSTSIAKLLLLPKFDNSSPFVTQDKEICHVIISQWRHYHLRRSTQWNPFNVYLLSKFDVSSFFVTGVTQIFKLVILLTLSSSKFMFILLTLGKSKLTLLVSFLLTLERSQLFYWVWVWHATKNNPNPLSLIKIQEPSVGYDTFQIVFNDSISGNQELVSSVNK